MWIQQIWLQTSVKSVELLSALLEVFSWDLYWWHLYSELGHPYVLSVKPVAALWWHDLQVAFCQSNRPTNLKTNWSVLKFFFTARLLNCFSLQQTKTQTVTSDKYKLWFVKHMLALCLALGTEFHYRLVYFWIGYCDCFQCRKIWPAAMTDKYQRWEIK